MDSIFLTTSPRGEQITYKIEFFSFLFYILCMSSKIEQKEKSNKSEDPLKIMYDKCKEYGGACDMVIRYDGYRNHRSPYPEKVKRLKPELIELTANNLIQAEPTKRKEIIDQITDSMGKAIWGWGNEGYVVKNFLKDTLLRVLEIIASNKEK